MHRKDTIFMNLLQCWSKSKKGFRVDGSQDFLMRKLYTFFKYFSLKVFS